MSKKWNLIIDVPLCENCNNCVLSAKDEYVGNQHKGYSAPLAENNADVIVIERNVRGSAPIVDTSYLVKMCNHCDNAPCMKVAGDAIKKRDDGIVIIDPEKAKGRKDIVKSCPYGAIVWNEEQQLPQTWIFDAHLLDGGWEKPRCQQSCPTGAFDTVKISDEDMQSRVNEEGLEVLLPQLDAKPRVYYKNLYRHSMCFIGGTVVADIDGIETCIENAKVTIKNTDGFLGETTTDEYGEFKIDRIAPNSGKYEVCISAEGFNKKEVVAGVRKSLNLGLLTLHTK